MPVASAHAIPHAVTWRWQYTAGCRRPTWARPYPFARGCSGEVLFYSLLLTLALAPCFCYRLCSCSALCRSALLVTTEPAVGSRWPRAPSTASCRAAIHEESRQSKHSEELHPVRFHREEELAIDDSPPSSSNHVATSSSFPMVHWYSSTHSPPSATHHPRHRWVSPSITLHHHRPTALVRIPPPFTPNQVHHLPGLLPDHSTTDHRPSADRILPASRRHRWGRRAPLFWLWAKRVKLARSLSWARPSTSAGSAHCTSDISLLSFKLFKLNSKISLNFRNS
jgi:hypothetical protein